MTKARGLRLGVALVLAALAQVSLPAVVSWWPAAPAFVLAIVAAVAWTAGPTAAAVAGFGGGLLLDTIPPAAHPVGQWAVVLAVLGYVLALVLDHEERIVPAVLALAIAVASAPFLYAALGVTLGQTPYDVGILATLEALAWGAGAGLLTLPRARSARRPEPPLALRQPLPAGLHEGWERAA
ncbi:MAG: hypothetical protein ACT4QG_20150 [Sporichthyaceae bacterium]